MPLPTLLGRRLSTRTSTAVLLLIGFTASAVLVLSASAKAFAVPPPGPTGLVVSGTSALFAAGPLAPGEHRTGCITVDYAGEADDVEVALTPTVDDAGLADHLDITIVEGACDGAAVGRPVFAGTLTELGQQGAAGVGAFAADTGARRSYRITVDADTELPASATADVDLGWTVTA